MNESKNMELTNDLYDTMIINDIIFASYAHPGAMGVPGEILIYSLNDGNIYCYETNYFRDKKLYDKIIDVFEKNQITSRFNDKIVKENLFKFYGAGMGNNCLINKNVSINIDKNDFVIIKDNKEYRYNIENTSYSNVFMYIYNKQYGNKNKYRKHRLRDFLENDQ